MTATARTWGGLRVWLALAMLAYVWRVQDLFTWLAVVKPVTLATGAVLLLTFMDPGALTRLNALFTQRPAQFAYLLGALVLASVPTSLYPGLSFGVALKDAIPAVVLMALVAASIRAPVDAFRLATIQVLGAAIYAVVILVRFNVGPGGRLGDLVYYDANDLGMFLACTLPLAAWLTLHGRYRLVQFLGAAALILFILTIIKSGSRGAFLGVVAVVLYAVVGYRSAKLSHRVALAAGLGFVLVLAAGGAYWKAMNTMLHPTADYNWIGNEEGGRMSVWKRGLGYMSARPLTGVGVGAFPVAEGTLSPLAQRQRWGYGVKWSVAHNSFVQAGAELGAVGLIAFVGLLVSGIAMARRTVRRSLRMGRQVAAALADALGASLVGFAISGFFLSQAYAPFLYAEVGLVLGLGAALGVRTGRRAPVRSRAVSRAVSVSPSPARSHA